MKPLLAACFCLLLLGCQTTNHISRPLAYTGGDGSSMQQAVVISDANYRETGVLQERTWLANQYPGYREVAQKTASAGDKHYDLIELTTADGQAKRVYFDSTAFYGK